MSKEMRIYRRFTNNVERLLTVYGLFPHQQSIVKYLSILVLVSYCLLFYVIVTFFRIHIGNISAIIACFSLLTTTTNVAIKIVQFLRNRERLAHIGDTLETLFEEASLKQPSSSLVFQYLRPCYRLMCYQFVSMFFTAILYTSKPLIDILVRSANLSTPFPTIYPWPVVSTASLAVHYLYEFSMSLSFSIITTAVDAFFTLCSFRVCSVFRAMAVELKESPKYHTENREQLLRKCIERHTTLIECRDGIQEIYGPVVLSVTLTNGLGMCALIFEVLRAEDITLEKAAALSLYLFGKIIQTLTYAWPGDMITSEDEVFRREVYCNDWYEHSNIRITKLSIMILSQRLMVVKAYNLLVISLDLFVKIMNRTLSYYFLLVTLDDAE